MPAFVYYSDELLQPISAEQPCGQDLRHDRLFGEILDARRSDDEMNAGDWEKQEGRKLADWEKVANLCLNALTTRTKDLRLACFLAEASLHMDGFKGLHQSLRLCRELLLTFWEQGLHPGIEDGDLDYRAGSLNWLNDPMPDILRQTPITARKEENYNFISYKRASIYARTTNPDALEDLRRQGYITMDSWNSAVGETRRRAFETIYSDFEEADKALLALSRACDDKFGDATPSFMNARDAFAEMKGILDPILRKKREEEPDKPAGEVEEVKEDTPQAPRQAGLGVLTAGLPSDQSHSWGEAEALIRAGKTDQGLAQMAALAASEGSMRARFLRKLMLADVCLGLKRERLARTVLQELNTQIVDFKLVQWESSTLVGAVWSRLYRLYRKSESSDEQDQAASLYTQLCQLDPWQAYLNCED
jgi:type VI secretion system protein ImpA